MNAVNSKRCAFKIENKRTVSNDWWHFDTDRHKTDNGYNFSKFF